MSSIPPSSVQADLEAILDGAAFAPITDRAFLRITGPDATRWLNGMVTNSVQSLGPGEGNYNFLLNAQGRIQGDCTIFREPAEGDAAFLLETGSSQLETVSQLLDKFIIMDDVELAGIYEMFGLLLLGPNVKGCITRMADAPCPQPNMVANISLNGHPALVTRHANQYLPIYELWFRSPISAEHTARTLKTAGCVEVSPEALEAFRILVGTPRFGADIRQTDLPQETNQPHALHFAKGCYLGQEIVERIRSRGQVHRLFTAFTLEGDLPASLPTPLEANGKPAGEITSAARVPLPEGEAILALGYARREALDTKQTLTYPGGTAVPRTLPS